MFRALILGTTFALAPAGNAQQSSSAQSSDASPGGERQGGVCNPISNNALTLCVPQNYQCFERRSDLTGDTSALLADWAICLAQEGDVITFEYLPVRADDLDWTREMLEQTMSEDGEPIEFAGGKGYWTHSTDLEPETGLILRQVRVGVMRDDAAINIAYATPNAGSTGETPEEALWRVITPLNETAIVE